MHRDDEAASHFFDNLEDLEQDQEQEGETVEQKLAQYAFVREEREREVRLIFRDVPAYEMAVSFRAAGAQLITIAGERVQQGGAGAVGASSSENTERALVESQPRESGRRRRRHERAPQPPTGDVVLRYFFAMGELVYTVILAAPAGVMGSIAAIFPVARLSEEEIQSRLRVVFT